MFNSLIILFMMWGNIIFLCVSPSFPYWLEIPPLSLTGVFSLAGKDDLN